MLLQALLEGIALRKGVTVVTGAGDASRTALCRALAEQTDDSTFTALLLRPVYSETELLSRILQDFGVVSRDQSRVGHRVGVAPRELTEAIERFLRGLPPIKAGAVLIVDNAQTLLQPVLLQIAALAELHDAGVPLLQVVLTGSPELERLLQDPELRPLDARVSTRYELEGLPAGPATQEASSPRRRSLAAIVTVVLAACALAVGLSIALLRRFGF